MVVGLTERQADVVFHALADATRRDIVLRVLDTEQSVSNLARNYAMSFAAVQKHVAVLQAAGVIKKRPVGREQLVSGDVDAIRGARSLLDAFEATWRSRLDRFQQLLDENAEQGSAK